MKAFFLSIIIVVLLFSCETKSELKKLSGPIFGTSYNIQYYTKSNQDFSKSIDSLFYVINKSMSNYQANSIISKINRNEFVEVDSHFTKVFNTSKVIYKQTEGVFNPAIGALVNYWNFGAEKNENKLDSLKIDNLMRFVDFSKVDLSRNLIRKQKEAYIDFNAVAKGYAVDVISEFLSKKQLENHLVEIGGEIRVEGENLNKKMYWKVGVQQPNFNGETDYDKVLFLRNEAMATSGTYRKFKIDVNGNRYAHIINSNTGYPTKTNVLSVSVIAPNCMLADAYATAFQAMGVEKTTSFLKNHPELKVYFIFENEANHIETLALNKFPE
jgi:thiamine biosynthesis lipoprotein